ncbi:hypothetical protein ACJMK2_013917 [Sinanodonta woodiana]|uniref:WW domain-containing protein n=1 Tax=Sinanodonta woodiana TaxID=1069815 RepID=A0ABD3UYY8_SINWO
MVMHARKHPRLNDGYVDKREAHPFQSTQYPSKKYSSTGGGYDQGDPYNRNQSPSLPRDDRDSSPSYRDGSRYINKASYTERVNQKYDRGSVPSPEKKHNHSYQGSGSNSNNGHHSNQDYKDSRISQSKDSSDKKTELHKSALQVCGDWSEHISSSGKHYYYNIKTEVSQWEKPKDWNDQMCRTENEKPSSSTCKDSRYRHSSGSERKGEKQFGSLRQMVQDSNIKPDKQYLFEKLQASQSKIQAELRVSMASQGKTSYSVDPSKMDSSNRHSDSNAHSHHHHSLDHSSSSSSNRRYRRDSEGSRSRHDRRHDNEDMDISPSSSPSSSRPSSCTDTPQLQAGSTPVTVLNQSSVSTAAGNTPSSTSNLNITSIPRLITQLSGGQNNQELTQKALQTLQKLQDVLSRQIAAHQSTLAGQMVQQPAPATPTTTVVTSPLPSHMQRSPYQSGQNMSNSHPHVTVCSANSTVPIITSSHPPIVIPVSQGPNSGLPPLGQAQTVYGRLGQAQIRASQMHEEEVAGDESPRSRSGGNRSPAPSDTSSRDADIDPETLSKAADFQNREKTDILSSLRQYYNENLIGHVVGWQAEHAERQAQRYCEEGLTVGSLMCSQVSVELKRCRSLVRVAEIQSTLNEQRTLFLSQQIHELDNMKPGSSFLAASSASSIVTSSSS